MDASTKTANAAFCSLDYKSPLRTLARFFRKSRDQWKNKAQKLKREQKRLQNRVGYARRSQEEWKSRVEELEQQLAQEQTKVRGLEDQLAAVEKKS